MSNQINTEFTPETYVDPFPGKADTDTVWEQCYCNGTGHLKHYEHIDGGICYGCEGMGGRTLHVGDERKREKARASRRNSELRKTAKQQTAHNERVAAYEAEYPQLSGWWDAISEDHFLADLWAKAFNYELSEKQVAAAAKAMDRKAEWAEKKKAEAIAKAALPPAPVGKVEVTGTIVSVKYKESSFGPGGSWKMVVEGDEGWRVWSTIPAKIIDAAMEEQAARDSSEDEEFVGWSSFLEGRKITFTATLEASERDKSFAFAKRPTKAVIAP